MRTVLLVLAMSVLAQFGCAARSSTAPPTASIPRQYEGTPPAADAGTSSDPSAAPTLQMTIPDGWVQLPAETVPPGFAGALGNPTTHARILVMVGPSSGTPEEMANQLSTALAESGVTCGTIVASADGSSASFTTLKDGVRGKASMKRLSVEPAITLMLLGMWPDAVDAAMTADFDALSASAAVR